MEKHVGSFNGNGIDINCSKRCIVKENEKSTSTRLCVFLLPQAYTCIVYAITNRNSVIVICLNCR